MFKICDDEIIMLLFLIFELHIINVDDETSFKV